jgi:Predicted membrane protein
MKNSKSIAAKKTKVHKNRVLLAASAGVLIILLAAVLILTNKPAAGENTTAGGTAADGIVIDKSKITSTVSFIPYKANGTNMEVIAVKAPDGTIRTAFNTCQVCFDSGRGYYKQQGDELVCQNCGNRFKISQVEKEKNGCNPVPVSEADKTDNGSTITISKAFLAQNAALFSNWKK